VVGVLAEGGVEAVGFGVGVFVEEGGLGTVVGVVEGVVLLGVEVDLDGELA